MPTVVQESEVPKRTRREARDWSGFVDGNWRTWEKSEYDAQPQSFISNAQKWARENGVTCESRKEGDKIWLRFTKGKSNGKPSTRRRAPAKGAEGK